VYIPPIVFAAKAPPEELAAMAALRDASIWRSSLMWPVFVKQSFLPSLEEGFTARRGRPSEEERERFISSGEEDGDGEDDGDGDSQGGVFVLKP
jgi:hypothetical protein